MAKSLDSRIEALEREQGITQSTVMVTLACKRCGHPLRLDDRGSACGTHPRIPDATTHLNISFKEPTNAEAQD
jgi:hypothetical protein